MRLLILSDLHREVWRGCAPRIDPLQSKPDVVILAGDIDNGDRSVDWAATTFSGTPVLYVQGNHEAYGADIDGTHASIESACDRTDNVHLLQCNEYFLDDVRFLGTTLWTDFALYGEERKSESIAASQAVVMDFRRVRINDSSRLVTPSDMTEMHQMQRGWLREKLGESFPGRTVVITHMAPSFKSISPRYARDLASSCFASNLDDLASKADLWIHGHTHDSFDYQIGKCRVLCNPCGYMTRGGGTENPAFDPNFVVEFI